MTKETLSLAHIHRSPTHRQRDKQSQIKISITISTDMNALLVFFGHICFTTMH